MATAAIPVVPTAWWLDRRFQLPAAFVGASLIAVGTFALLHRGLRPPPSPEALKEIAPAYRDEGGYFFPEQGYVLCPQGAGIEPTSKRIQKGTFVVLWLATPAGQFVERTWGEVAEEDQVDPNRIKVVIRGELTPTGQRSLKSKQHGFDLSQVFWMTKDCVPDAYNEIDDPHGALLCGAHLIAFDGADADRESDGYRPAAPPPLPAASLVGWTVELLLVSRAGKGTAWQVPVTAEIISVGPTGDVPRVRVLDVAENEFADDPVTGHKIEPGDEFDAPWDCITRYIRS